MPNTMSLVVDDEEKQQALLAAVRQLNSSDVEIPGPTLARYLRARKGNVNQAAKLLHSTLQWRASLPIDTLSADEFGAELTSGRMYVAGPDKDGHAILITRKKSDVFQPGQMQHYLRHLAFTLETCVRVMEPRQSTWVWILDMAGYTRANSPPLSVSLATLRILADHYPERLKACFFVDAPAVFSWLWAALSPLLDPVTAKKVQFIKSSDLPAETAGAAAATPVPPLFMSDAMQSFLPYVEYYRTPYSEARYRRLLSKAGW